jgi:hypothetical protein
MDKIRLHKEDPFRGAWKRNRKDRFPRENIFAEERAQYKRLVGAGGNALTKEDKNSLVAFMKSKQYSQLQTQAADLITQLHNVGMERRLNYFLYGESLLGSWWHHGMILGDTTVVVFIGGRTRIDFRQGLRLLSGYTITDRGAYFEFKSKPQPGVFQRQGGNSLTLRMEFYNENVTHIWESIGRSPMYFNKGLFFPVHKRPFCGTTVIVPRDTMTVLQMLFGPNDLCPQPPIGDRNEVIPSDHILKIGWKVRCKSLFGVVPFVDRVVTTFKNVTKVREVLTIDYEDVLKTVDLPARGRCLVPLRDSLRCYINGTTDYGAIPV